ncbi:MAG: hypothetical protein FD157_1121 [Rhodocyclaceae bacterium]|nr:MAG: hypothetical protein FD157_1121 [Rhodocyclaceae bacterium]TND06147.1 MAG: hypothetical protein FD118_219 [Rhodocyclaceae bacterium]
MIQKAADSASIVLIGSFNPGIFHPAWFEKQMLLPATETDNATIEMISNDIAIFTMAWVRIEVVGERFVAKTADESKFGPLRDLVIGTFRLLEYTPVKQIGMNREIQYRMPNEDSWHCVGHTLAPKESWLPYVKTPGMKSLVIESRRDDDRDGLFNISVKPVLKQPLPAKDWLVEVAFNDHVELGENKTALDACKVLDEDWDKALTRAGSVCLGLISDTAK